MRRTAGGGSSLPGPGSGAPTREDEVGREKQRRGNTKLRAALLASATLLAVAGVARLSGAWVPEPPPQAVVRDESPDVVLRASGDDGDDISNEVVAATPEEVLPAAAIGDPELSEAPFEAAKPGVSEDEHINDILDQLMGLHRQDVKKRETDMTEARDMPVLNSDAYLVVSMADGGYAACATRLLETARGAGRWGGRFVILVPVGEGSVPLDSTARARLLELGAELLEVPPDSYGAGGGSVRGAGAASQYAKVRLLEDEAFRNFDAVLFLDADGVVGAPLQPLLEMEVPEGRVVAMPTWPTTRQKHDSFYDREISFKALEPEEARRLKEEYPDRKLVGITAWFVLKPRRLPPPATLRSEVDAALVAWRPGFRFNDQGLWNVLFYHTAAFYPLCISGPDPSEEGSVFEPLIVDSLDRLGDVIDAACGPGHERRKPMYDHPRKDCLPQEEWERKKRANRDLSDGKRQDLLGAFDQNNLGKHKADDEKSGRPRRQHGSV